ncbi:hypothetical protein HMN09_00040200 [Mycena chlorophos]|uniref:Poly(A) polymerase n=1 Tax=Mycena chlorophos TaxID=658473 RepID=A0A8H6TTS2_MYCCL|nr:hypothetical protein HMN09_00040200 [Mycena chlorophos]
MAAEKGYLGVTPPISVAQSSDREREITVSLMDELRRQNTFETEEEEIVLGRVAALVKKFVRDVSLAKGLSEAAANAAGGKIFTFGSYRLGVHGPGTDIDTCCVLPRHVTREDFFNVFEPMVRAAEGATEVSGVPDAFVPMIGANISGISMDLLCAPLNLSSIPEDLSLKDNNILKNLDESVVRSVNGTRLTDELLRLIPNVQVFRDALRCIKLWAQRKAIYSNKIGYLGGVAWAMLVARICQLYPNAAAGAIVTRFFTVMSKWPWPQPVLLKQIEEGPLQVRVWNPKVYPSDKAHRMPIITPNYPSMCATHNVSASTHAVMMRALVQGAAVLDNIVAGTSSWSELFTKHDFFHRYKHYIQIIAIAKSRQTRVKWSGTVESKLRHLIGRLEFVDNLELPHPFPKGFDRTITCKDAEEAANVLRGEEGGENVPDDKEESAQAEAAAAEEEGEEGGNKVYVTNFFIGLGIRRLESKDSIARRLDMGIPIADFTKLVKGDNFDDTNMGIALRHIRRTGLPPYVFDAGEQEATQGAKATGKRSRKSLGSSPPAKRLKMATVSA